MSAFDRPALHAIASQLMATLDTYDANVASLLAAWPQLDSYEPVSRQIEQIRMYSSALDSARVQWVELLIAHAELVHVLWRTQYGQEAGARAKVDEVRERHQDSVRALRNRCARIIGTGSHLS